MTSEVIPQKEKNLFLLKKEFDYRNMHDFFHTNFDHSLMEHALKSILNAKQELPYSLCGEGTFFIAYKVFLNHQAFCLKILKNKALLQEGRLKWLQNLSSISKLKHRLLAPIALINSGKNMAIASIFGSHNLDNIPNHWLPLENEIRDLKIYLQSNGYILLDSIQPLTWNNIPFICDISDIEKL